MFLLALGLAAVAPVVASAATGAIAGTVSSEATHLGLAGVEVCAYEEGEEAPSACAETAPSPSAGTFILTGLAPGEYLVEFFAPRELGNYVTEYYDDQVEFEEAEPVEVESSQTTTGIDVELEPGASIAGTVKAAGSPVAEVIACAGFSTSETYFSCAPTDEDGKYEIIRLVPGSYHVAFLPFYTGLNLLEQFWDHKTTWEAGDPIVLAAQEAKAGVDADLEPGAEIRGTVRSAATSQPLGGIVVCSVLASSGQLWGCTKTGPAGSYTLNALSGGMFKVVFSLEWSEFFPGELNEPDGYPTQFFNGKGTLGAADVLTTKPPGVITGIDASLGTPPPVPIPTPKPKPKPKKCKRGFKKKRVKGKVRCVKVHKHRHHGR